MIDTNLLIYSVFFSLVGMGFYYFGKRNSFYFKISGLVLMIFPYFVSTLTSLLIIGALCIIVPLLLTWFFPL